MAADINNFGPFQDKFEAITQRASDIFFSTRQLGDKRRGSFIFKGFCYFTERRIRKEKREEKQKEREKKGRKKKQKKKEQSLFSFGIFISSKREKKEIEREIKVVFLFRVCVFAFFFLHLFCANPAKRAWCRLLHVFNIMYWIPFFLESD